MWKIHYLCASWNNQKSILHKCFPLWRLFKTNTFDLCCHGFVTVTMCLLFAQVLVTHLSICSLLFSKRCDGRNLYENETVYGDYSYSHSTAAEWCNKFQQGDLHVLQLQIQMWNSGKLLYAQIGISKLENIHKCCIIHSLGYLVDSTTVIDKQKILHSALSLCMWCTINKVIFFCTKLLLAIRLGITNQNSNIRACSGKMYNLWRWKNVCPNPQQVKWWWQCAALRF